MRFLSMRFLSERNLLFSASCFVKIFAEYFQESSMIEEFVPVWLVVNMINTEDEGMFGLRICENRFFIVKLFFYFVFCFLDMVQSSNFVYNGLSAFFAQRGFNIIDKKLNYVSAIEVSQWIFKVGKPDIFSWLKFLKVKFTITFCRSLVKTAKIVYVYLSG